MNTWLRALLLLLTFSLTACMPLATQQLRPEVTVPEQFSASGTSSAEQRWWLALGDENLNQLIESSLQGNLALRNIWQRLLQARALAAQAGAEHLPSLDAEASVTKTEASQRSADSRTLSLGLAASYELDLWGRIEASSQAASQEALASELAYQAATISLTAEVANTWYRYAEQSAQIKLLKEQLAINQQTLELIEFRFRQGKVGATDVLQQRQLVETQQGEILNAASSAQVLRHALAVLQATAPGHLELAEPAIPDTLPELPITGLPAELIKHRPDIHEALLRVRAADQRVAAAMANRYPRLSLSASIRTSSSTLGDLLEDWLGTIAASLIAPLFDAGEREAAVSQQRAILEERVNDYGLTILKALQEIEDALQQEQYQTELIDNLRRRVSLSEEIIQRTRDNYNNGVTDYLRVLDAQLTHQSLQRNLITAQRQLTEFRIALYRALARGWPSARPTQGTNTDVR